MKFIKSNDFFDLLLEVETGKLFLRDKETKEVCYALADLSKDVGDFEFDFILSVHTTQKELAEELKGVFDD